MAEKGNGNKSDIHRLLQVLRYCRSCRAETAIYDNNQVDCVRNELDKMNIKVTVLHLKVTKMNHTSNNNNNNKQY